MFKKELIWREILYQAIERNIWEFTQQNLAKHFLFSLSTIAHALIVPRQLGCIEVHSRYFLVKEIGKFLALWGTQRNFHKDICYQTFVDQPILTIESQLPPDAIFTAYSGYRLKFHDVPADYDQVIVYSKNPTAIQHRFPPNNQVSFNNVIVLQSDPWLTHYGTIVPLAQMYVDLWNQPNWYAKEFIQALSAKINI